MKSGKLQVYIDESVGNHGCSDGMVVEFDAPYSLRGIIVNVSSCENDQFHCPGDPTGTHRSNRANLLGDRVYIGVPALTFARLMELVRQAANGKLAEDYDHLGDYWWLAGQ